MKKPGPERSVEPYTFGRPAAAEDQPGFMRRAEQGRAVTWFPGAEHHHEAEPTPPPAPKPVAKPKPAPAAPPPEAASAAETQEPPASAPPEPAPSALPPGAIITTEAEIREREAELVDLLREPYREAARDLRTAVVELQQRLHEDLVDLAARMAQALIYREVRLDRSIMLDIAHRALRLAGTMERVVIKCSEEDAEFLRAELAEVARGEAGAAVEVVVRPSDDIDVGGCLLTFEGGIVDARNDKRLDRIIEAVKAAVADAPVAEAHGSTRPPPPAPPAAEELDGDADAEEEPA